MANFEVISKTGTPITVPDYSRIQTDGLILVGDYVEDWNEPIQQNTMILNKRIYDETQSRIALETSSKEYADSVGSSVLQSAKDYVDNSISGIQGGGTTSGGTTTSGSKLEMYFYGGL